MNTFNSMEGILGDTSSQHLKRTFAEFLAQSRLIRDRLGKQAYLFDQYLSLLLESANCKLAHGAASEGFDGEAPMFTMCLEILRHKPKDTENPLYDIMKTYIDANPLSYQEDVTKRAVYCVMLSGELLENAVKLFKEELTDRFREVVDIVDLRDLYRKICAILGSEDEMEKLHLLFRQRFLIATPVAVFTQGAANQLIYSLLRRDRETSRQVFQLILDEMPHMPDGLQD